MKPDSTTVVSLSDTVLMSRETLIINVGLKHGGHERVLSQEGVLKAPKDCEFREEGNWIILKVRGGELKYPRPVNWVGMGKTKYSAGETIGAAYNTTSPIYRLNGLIKLMNATGSHGVKYYEKDNVYTSDCYAYEEGEIKYIENKRGGIDVVIGSKKYAYADNSIYYYPEGTMIKKYQRFCSGQVNMRQVASDLGDDVNGIFTIFRRQFYTLNNPKYASTGVVEPDYMQEEVVETLFAGLVNQVENEKDSTKIDRVDFLGTQTAILNRKSFFTTLSYGWSSKVISRAMKGELDIEGDTMTETVLSLILNDELDKKK